MVRLLGIQSLDAYDPIDDKRAYSIAVFSFKAEAEEKERSDVDSHYFRYEDYDDGVVKEEAIPFLKKRFRNFEIKDVAFIDGEIVNCIFYGKALVIVEHDNPINRDFRKHLEEVYNVEI